MMECLVKESTEKPFDMFTQLMEVDFQGGRKKMSGNEGSSGAIFPLKAEAKDTDNESHSL